MANRTTNLNGLLARAERDAPIGCADRELLARFVAGDEAAFAALLDRHGPMVAGNARRLLRDDHLAEDVLQATFLALVRHARSIRHRDHLAGWLLAVARRLALAQAARERREDCSPRDADAGRDELLQALDEELDRLPPRVRLPLILCYLEGRTRDEAAAQLGWSVSTLRRRLDQGRALLEARLTRRGLGLGVALLAGSGVPTALSAETHSTILRLMRPDAMIAAPILALARGAMPMPATTKLILGSLLALAVAGGFAAAGRLGSPTGPNPAAAAEPPPPPAERRDLFNDPLPAGAIARLGTISLRHERVNYKPALHFMPDGKHLISASALRLHRWDLATGASTLSLGDTSRNNNASWYLVTPDARQAYMFSKHTADDGFSGWRCVKYDLETGAEIAKFTPKFQQGNQDDNRSVPSWLTPDGKLMASFDYYQAVINLRHVEDGSLVRAIRPPPVMIDSGAVVETSLAFTPYGRTMILANFDSTFRVYDVESGKQLRTFGNEGGNRTQMELSPDGRLLAAWAWPKLTNPPNYNLDKLIRLWDVERGTEVRTLEFPDSMGVSALCFTPDGRTLLAATTDWSGRRLTTVRTWDVATGKPGWSLPGDPSREMTMTVDRDGKKLATMNEAGAIRLWDMATGKELQPHTASPVALDAITFRPDGKIVITVGADGVVREWDAAAGPWPSRARCPDAAKISPSKPAGG
jgi:RNA polymerase sigma factor (sigma-70 family)